jgi:hypothetical protein
MNANHFRQLAIFLTNLNDGSADWGEIAKQRGVTMKGNAQRDFKVMMRKYGLEYASSRFTLLPTFDPGDRAAINTTSKSKKPSTSRKRKADTDGEEDQEGKTSPVKKTKGTLGPTRPAVKDEHKRDEED